MSLGVVAVFGVRCRRFLFTVPALCTFSNLSSLHAQSPGLWVDSVSTPAYIFGASGSASNLVRITLRVGSRISEIATRGEEAKQFGDSAALLLANASRSSDSGSHSVGGMKLRMTSSTVGGIEVVRFRVGGEHGVDIQPATADAIRIVGILRGAAFWAVEQHRASLKSLPTPGASEGAYFEFQVQRPVVPSRANPPAKYPPMLRSANVEGTVLGQFVVDTLGRVDMSSFHILKSTHDLFTAAVKDVVPRYKFSAAEIRGQKVKQLVQMPFDFTISP